MSIDENTTVAELAKILEVDSKKVKDAVSLYCRLGFAKKKNSAMDSTDIQYVSGLLMSRVAEIRVLSSMESSEGIELWVG